MGVRGYLTWFWWPCLSSERHISPRSAEAMGRPHWACLSFAWTPRRGYAVFYELRFTNIWSGVCGLQGYWRPGKLESVVSSMRTEHHYIHLSSLSCCLCLHTLGLSMFISVFDPQPLTKMRTSPPADLRVHSRWRRCVSQTAPHSSEEVRQARCCSSLYAHWGLRSERTTP